MSHSHKPFKAGNVRDVMKSIQRTAQQRMWFTSEQVRADLEKRRISIENRNHIGVAFRTASKLGMIKHTDVTQSNVPSANGRLVRVWEAA